MNEIRIRLKHCEPYFIEHELLPLMYFRESENKTEYWIFFYSFIRRLSDEAIGVRLGYSRQQILNKTKAILKFNLTMIQNFLQKHNK